METLTAENKALLKDPKFYLESFCKIRGKLPGSLVPFVLNPMQLHLFNAMRKHARIIILKARQLGASTGVVGFLYHETVTVPSTVSALIAYNADLASEFLDKVKVLWKTTPPELQPTIKYNSKYEISFPAMDSKILVLPSTDTAGRGYTLTNCLCSEIDFWDNGEDKLVAIEAAVPITGKLILESTPNGIGGILHDRWMRDNDYHKLEYGWWWGYSKEEIDTIRKRMNNEMKFAQEYGLEFLSSGRNVFDRLTMAVQKKNILKPGAVRELPDKSTFTVFEANGWTYFEPPLPEAQYVMGVDTSEGIEGGDYSVACLFNRANGEQAAFYRGLIAPDLFADVLDKVGRQYHNAHMVVEVNNHGLVTLTRLRNLAYPSLYFRPSKFDAMGTPSSDRIGWKTTKVTKPLLLGDFIKMLREGEVKLHSKETVDEMSVFVYDQRGEPVPQSDKYHDDCIMASGIACQGFKVTYTGELEQIDYNEHVPGGEFVY